MVPVFLLRSVARGASLLSLPRFQCTAMKARSSGIAANRYLTGNSGNIPISSRASPENPATVKSNNDPPSSGSPPPPPTTAPAEHVYVHPLSQIVLQNLQSEECHEWITRAGLDRNLTVHRDGTFSLESLTTTTTARIWTEYCPDEKKHWLIYNSSTGGDRISSSADDYMNQAVAAATTGVAATITTVQHKYLLQDNLRTAWQKGTKSSSAPDRIQEFVRELMLTVR
jgi:hypothetical protein